ncbi:hypothetical protein CAEBREN_15273 [Caenorhabditis brenneri]|uniref:Seven TM Receptor n=1 Tax=Caenorhabditis brenneri TaxID=135651 RepID=G0P653_CAEBE|nr:hypothetical protein CAEBREN_15273 [Caenorhabditis brenneri]
MISYELSNAITHIGFFISFIVNFILIYLTMFHIKKVTGTYKHMVVIFSLSGILFTAMEIVARPFSHNLNSSLLYFSFNNWVQSKEFRTFLIASWAGFYIQIVSFVAVQFVYRYICLFDGKLAKKFAGAKSILLILFPWFPGAFYLVMLHLLCLPDEFSNEFFRSLTTEKYQLEVNELPSLPIIPYTPDGQIRMNSFMILILGGFLTSSPYFVMVYCGFKMHFNMKKELAKFSACHQKLQLQFFKALIAQSIGPTLFLVLPIAPILLTPLIPPQLGIFIDWQTGWLFSMIGAYSPFDSIAFMVIVTEYKNVIKSSFLGEKKIVRWL